MINNLIKIGKFIYTKNLAPGKRVYDENLVKRRGKEYRKWNPAKSKLGAGIVKGIRGIDISATDIVLYLGASTGTTVSHVSDIVDKGFVFALDSAPRVLRDLIFVAEQRKNIAPILANANHPEEYKELVTQSDIVFQDIAQKNQVEIFLKNVKEFLTKKGTAILAIKCRSIDTTKSPKEIYKQVKKELSKQLNIIDALSLEPLEKDHYLFVCKKK